MSGVIALYKKSLEEELKILKENKASKVSIDSKKKQISFVRNGYSIIQIARFLFATDDFLKLAKEDPQKVVPVLFDLSYAVVSELITIDNISVVAKQALQKATGANGRGVAFRRIGSVTKKANAYMAAFNTGAGIGNKMIPLLWDLIIGENYLQASIKNGKISLFGRATTDILINKNGIKVGEYSNKQASNDFYIAVEDKDILNLYSTLYRPLLFDKTPAPWLLNTSFTPKTIYAITSSTPNGLSTTILCARKVLGNLDFSVHKYQNNDNTLYPQACGEGTLLGGNKYKNTNHQTFYNNTGSDALPNKYRLEDKPTLSSDYIESISYTVKKDDINSSNALIVFYNGIDLDLLSHKFYLVSKIGLVNYEIDLSGLSENNLEISTKLDEATLANKDAIVSVTWDWGDGNKLIGTSIQANHTYLKSGKYTISVIIRRASGQNAIKSMQIDVNSSLINKAPTNLSAVSGDKEVGLSWNAVSGATYNLYYGTSTITDISLASLSKVPNISTNTKTITNLTNDTKYYFVITAVKDSIESVKSNEVNASPSLKVVKDICKVGKTEHGLASMLFNLDETTASYDNPGYVTASYLMFPYSITGIQAHAGIDFRTKDGANAGRHKVYSLSSGKIVKAENGTNYGAVGIKTTNKANENIVIFYSHLDSTTLIVGDKVEIGTLIGLSGKKGTTAPHLHLEYRVNYTSNFMLGAKSCTNDDCSIAEIKTLTNDPIELLSLTCTQAITAVPTNLSAVSSDGQISLSWNAVSGATYNLYYGTSTITDISLASLSKVSNTKTIINLTNNTKYYFVITAVKDNIESLKSNEVNSIPKAVVVSSSNSKLNDTGITWGGDYSSGNNSTCTSSISAPQDCHTGRDKSGSTGFDFTRLDSNGSIHSGSAYSTSPWSCVRDNVTGLVWEVKTNDGSIHDKDNTYKWGGISAIGKNHPSKEGRYYDGWDSLVNGAKNASLCGFNDWRVPKKEELRSIVHYGTHNPSIDTAYFPNTVPSSFWSSSPISHHTDISWYVYFSNGYDSNYYRDYGKAVRLVRGGE